STSSGNTLGVFTEGVQKGFSITAPADTTARTLTVHVGGWNSSCTFTAHLSDGSAADFVDTTTTATGQFDRNSTLTYASALPGQVLTVTWTMASSAGNLTVNGAALR